MVQITTSLSVAALFFAGLSPAAPSSGLETRQKGPASFPYTYQIQQFETPNTPSKAALQPLGVVAPNNAGALEMGAKATELYVKGMKFSTSPRMGSASVMKIGQNGQLELVKGSQDAAEFGFHVKYFDGKYYMAYMDDTDAFCLDGKNVAVRAKRPNGADGCKFVRVAAHHEAPADYIYYG